MLNKVILAIIQGATEFLPISSSGHLALVSNLISHSDLFFFTALHLASLIAVLIFTRKELLELLSFDKRYRKIWIYLITGTFPAVLFGLLFRDVIREAFSSFLFVGIAFIFTGVVLFLTKFYKERSSLNLKNAVIIGLFQVLGLFPGASRSGMTISSALFLGINREKAVKFSFLLFIPLGIGAFMLEAGEGFYFDLTLLVSFLCSLVASLIFLNVLFFIAKKGKLWMFSIYCFAIGVISLALR